MLLPGTFRINLTDDTDRRTHRNSHVNVEKVPYIQKLLDNCKIPTHCGDAIEVISSCDNNFKF